MAEEPKLYDPLKVNVIIDGETVVGFTEGSMVECARAGERRTRHVGAKGEVTVVKSADPTGTITLHLKHNSSSLTKIHELDGRDEFWSASVEDTQTGERVEGSKCYIESMPDMTRGAEIEDIEVVIGVCDFTTTPPVNNQF